MKKIKFKSIFTGWTFSIILASVFSFYIAYSSITESDILDSYFSIDTTLVDFVNFTLIFALIILMLYSNFKKLLRKKSIIIYLLIILYSGLHFLTYYFSLVYNQDANYLSKCISSSLDIDKLYIYTPKHFIYKLFLVVNFIISISLFAFLLLFLTKRNSSKLIKLNNSLFRSFIAYLKKIANEVIDCISRLLSLIKSAFYYVYLKANFIYITNFIKIIKCSLKQDRVDHSLNLI